jgi:hypothetical protein
MRTGHVSRARSHYTAGIIIYGRTSMLLHLSSFKSRNTTHKRIFALIQIIYHGYSHTAVTAVTLAPIRGFALAGTLSLYPDSAFLPQRIVPHVEHSFHQILAPSSHAVMIRSQCYHKQPCTCGDLRILADFSVALAADHIVCLSFNLTLLHFVRPLCFYSSSILPLLCSYCAFSILFLIHDTSAP